MATTLKYGACFLDTSAESLYLSPIQKDCFHPTLKYLSFTHCTSRHGMVKIVSSSRGSHLQPQTLWRWSLWRRRGVCWCDLAPWWKVMLEHLQEASVTHRVLKWGREDKRQMRWEQDNGSKVRAMWHPEAHSGAGFVGGWGNHEDSRLQMLGQRQWVFSHAEPQEECSLGWLILAYCDLL